MMLRHGVKHIFGYPGGAILPVFDAIHASPHFDFILPRHEQGAGHMAEGYARATGKPGVVLVTSGPGATNVVTAMQDAMSDGTPMLVFCGQVPTSAIGTDAFQEADVIGISRHCTKWNVMVKDISELPRRINEAFEIATSGRPGPVLVDLPKDVTASILKEDVTLEPNIPVVRMRQEVSMEMSDRRRNAIEKTAELIKIAKKPVIYAGQGVINSEEGTQLLRELAEKANIPVTTTLQGMGAFDELHPLSLHMLGMHGSAYANFAMQSADLILAVGARFDDRVTGNLSKFAPEAKKAALAGTGGIVQFEILPKNINKTVETTIAVEGDLSRGLKELLPRVQFNERKAWLDQVNEWKRKHPFRFVQDHAPLSAGLKPQQVLDVLHRQLAPYLAEDKCIVTTGVGQHQMWAAQFLRWRHPRTFVTSGGLGTMGFGLPAAIGAKVARPDRLVLDIDGDASFSMTAMELMTASEFNIGVKVLVLNNNFQGMVRQWQDLFYDQRYSGTKMTNPDFVKLAESMGCIGIRVDKAEDLEGAMEAFLKDTGGRPILLEAVVEESEHVYPMVPAGKGLHEMVLGPPSETEKKN